MTVISEVLLGQYRIEPEFRSFYSEDLFDALPNGKLSVCEGCFKYHAQSELVRSHARQFCGFRDLKEAFAQCRWVYADSAKGIEVCEIDGDEWRLFTQNLSLFSKLFLDTKSVFYDVTTFLYYLLIYKDPATPKIPAQVIGFFSKEKLSWDNNNLACILIFPPWQRKGFGQVLMGLSYLLSRRERRIGGPEKPLSNLGRCAYTRFWAGALARCIVAQPSKQPLTIRFLSEATYILPEDIIATLREMEVLEPLRRKSATNGTFYINKSRVKAYLEKHRISLSEPVEDDVFEHMNPQSTIESECLESSVRSSSQGDS